MSGPRHAATVPVAHTLLLPATKNCESCSSAPACAVGSYRVNCGVDTMGTCETCSGGSAPRDVSLPCHKYRRVFDGECSDGYEVRLEDVSGKEEERAEQCASRCASRENAHSSDSWTTDDGVDIKDREIRGFLLHHDYDYCWCETSLGATCARTANNGYIRYDFTTPGVLVK